MESQKGVFQRAQDRFITLPLWVRVTFAMWLLASWVASTGMIKISATQWPLLIFLALPWLAVSITLAVAQMWAGIITLGVAARHYRGQAPSAFFIKYSPPAGWWFFNGISGTSLLLLCSILLIISERLLLIELNLSVFIFSSISLFSIYMLLKRKPMERSLNTFYSMNVLFFTLLSLSILLTSD
jgi:hypothetical protein